MMIRHSEIYFTIFFPDEKWHYQNMLIRQSETYFTEFSPMKCGKIQIRLFDQMKYHIKYND